MAQTGFTPIQLYSTSTAAAVPAAGNLTNSTLGSELAINITDGKLFYKDNANAVQVIGWKTTPTTAGGTGLTSYTAGDLSYYASGATLTKLGIGASTTILTSTGSAPQWSATSGITVGTATNLAGGLAGSVPYQTGAGATTFLGIGASGRFLSSTGSAPQWSAPAALTETDDTNVTMTLGGSPSTALLSAVSMTLGWTGQLATTRGGTGLSSFTANGVLYASSTSALATGTGLLFNGTQLSIATSTLSNARLTIDTAAQVGLDIFRSDVSANFSALRFRNTTNTASFGSLGFDSGGLRLNGDAGIIYLSTSGTEHARFTSGGDFFVGATSSPQTSKVFFTQTAAAGYTLGLNAVSNGGVYYLVNFFAANTQTGTISSNGTTTTYATTSDYRLKTVIGAVADAGQRIDALEPIEYDWNKGGRTRGFLAHKFAEVYPNSVNGKKDAVDKDGKLVYQSMQASTPEVMADLIAEIQSLRKRIATLENKL